ncbi:MAG: 30S ribosomal protein S6 [Blastocatellia bacterium]|nr:30S ribosomal protein S6 [Blastocatellia bacterium]MCS7156714.1 30S ribosomal protein S6 [Blastocatellia bacterium]MCX7751544.1 30S ribosomal protein S6 [Blastocatellia bacterium]MDW8168644.1 30S ribosomal protein S6 [Acidobacteriota bacterium]MDW8256539.1 30S ribosomal protein S6 [Acidobacteriota bacterium]
MRKYELLFIARPTLSDQETAALTEQVKGHIENLGATVTNVQPLGRRQLAYEIDHVREGTYVLMHFEGRGTEVAELDRRLRVSDAVLRHLIIRIDDELRRKERMKRRRQRKAARRAQAAASRQAREQKSGTRNKSGEEAKS